MLVKEKQFKSVSTHTQYLPRSNYDATHWWQ